MKVCKFGGTSLANAEQVDKVCRIVLADAERRIVVVSAPGKRFPEDTKVTDLLIQCAECRLAGECTDAAVDAVVARFREIADALELPPVLASEIDQDLRARVAGDVSHKARYLDALKAAGEDYNARLVAAALQARGVQAAYVNPQDAGLLLSDEYGNAQLLKQSYANLASLRDAEGIVVFPGFFGYTLDGEVVTFPRGGSDITGSILAAAVGADVYENFTDVDSVFPVDPRVVDGVNRPIPELSYREMRELSYAGFGVLHDEAIIPAVHAGIPIWIRCTDRPESPGTRIVPQRSTDQHGRVVGIASSDGFCTMFVAKYLMNREVGFGRKLLQVFEDEVLPYEHIPSGIDNLSIILEESRLDDETEQRLIERIRTELAADDVSIEHGLALIMIVGEGMRFTVGLAARATAALAEAGVNIEMMNQGSSEISMMFGVKQEDRARAVQALYDAFFPDASAEQGAGA